MIPPKRLRRLPSTEMQRIISRRPLCPAVAAVLLATAGTALAQTPAPTPPPVTRAPATAAFVLREVKLPPTRAVPAPDIQAVLQPFVGRAIGDGELAAIVQAVRALYEQRGYGLASVAYPKQDVSAGTLTLAIVEPRVNRIGITAPQPSPITEARVRGLMSHFGLLPEHALSIHALDRTMFALNDLPGVAAKATIGPAGDEGTFDINVELESRRAWDAQVELDNHGSRVTGRYDLGGLARWNNPFGLGDNLDARVMLSNGGGVTVGRVSYEAPLGYTAFRGGLGYSRVSYELGDELAILGATGTADVFDASVSYPLVRQRARNLVARAAVDTKALEDLTTATGLETESKKSVRALSLGLNYEGRDELGGGGFTGAALGLRAGSLKIKTADVALADETLGERRLGGGFRKFELQLTRLQAVTRSVSLYAGLTAQWASKNLDGSEKITLGGPKGVRSYPKAEGSSDEAAIFTGELRWHLTPQWTVFALADTARGKLQDRPQPDDGSDNTRRLKGAGLGVYFSDPSIFTLSATIARRGSQEALSEANSSRQRLFVQINRAF
jgi:hemolysin activation/secretion protein